MITSTRCFEISQASPQTCFQPFPTPRVSSFPSARQPVLSRALGVSGGPIVHRAKKRPDQFIAKRFSTSIVCSSIAYPTRYTRCHWQEVESTIMARNETHLLFATNSRDPSPFDSIVSLAVMLLGQDKSRMHTASHANAGIPPNSHGQGSDHRTRSWCELVPGLEGP